MNAKIEQEYQRVRATLRYLLDSSDSSRTASHELKIIEAAEDLCRLHAHADANGHLAVYK